MPILFYTFMLFPSFARKHYKIKLCGGKIANVKVLKCAKYRTTPEMYEVFAHGSHCGINILEFILESILTIFLCIGIIVITKEWIQ